MSENHKPGCIDNKSSQIDNEERRKMAWQLVLAVARSGVNVSREWKAEAAWNVVDSFIAKEINDGDMQ